MLENLNSSQEHCGLAGAEMSLCELKVGVSLEQVYSVLCGAEGWARCATGGLFQHRCFCGGSGLGVLN